MRRLPFILSARATADACGIRSERAGKREGEEGFLLLGAIVAIFLVLLILSVAAPTVAKQLRREREVESAHRADQYVRAIRLYYKKFGHYPGNMEQLEKSNNIRFLRQRYPDPLTGKADWRLIHVGEQKTTVKGFFGQPLAGIASSGLGSLSSSASPSGNGSPAGGGTSVFGSPGMSGPSGSSGLAGSSGPIGSSSAGGPMSGSGLAGGSGLGGSGAGSTSPSSPFGSSSGGLSSQSGTSFTGSGAPFLGIGSAAAGDSIVVVNEQTTYPTWEFIYDPRIEQMKAKSNLLGGGMAGGGSSGLGSLSPSSAGSSPASSPTSNPGPSTPTGPTTSPR